jgi:hypothetical protein
VLNGKNFEACALLQSRGMYVYVFNRTEEIGTFFLFMLVLQEEKKNHRADLFSLFLGRKERKNASGIVGVVIV